MAIIRLTLDPDNYSGRPCFCIDKKIKKHYYIEYLRREFLSYEDIDIAFFQCEEGMPDIDMMWVLISEIREMKPEIIISIGEDIFSM